MVFMFVSTSSNKLKVWAPIVIIVSTEKWIIEEERFIRMAAKS